MTGTSIRDARISDVSDIALLERLSFPIPWSRESIRHDIEENDNAVVLVSETNGTFSGYIDVWFVAGEGQVNNIAVMPEMRGKHVGLRLMNAMMERLSDLNAHCMILEVRESNLTAICLYKKLGFKEEGVRKRYYSDNDENALIMKKELNVQG